MPRPDRVSNTRMDRFESTYMDRLLERCRADAFYDVTTVCGLIEALGGIDAVANDCGTSACDVKRWAVRGNIPTGWHLRLFSLVNLTGKSVDPSIFGFEVLDPHWRGLTQMQQLAMRDSEATAAGEEGSARAVSSELLRYREAYRENDAVQRSLGEAYDAWVAEHATDFADYNDLLAGRLAPSATSTAAEQERWLRACSVFERRAATNTGSDIASRCGQAEEKQRRLANIIVHRRPRSASDLAETVEVLRTEWGWKAGEYSDEFTAIGCEDHIEALLTAVEYLAKGGTNG